jgi:putative ABC transport system ATP-binding protein
MALLEIARLRKSFITPDGSRAAVVDLPELALEAGEHLGLHGPSGTGKTTLLHLIAGILRPDSGTIQLAGHDLGQMPEPALDRLRATHLGCIFQTFNLLQGFTCLENIIMGMAFGPGVDRAWARHLLDRVGLASHADHRPAQLSTGQQQRIAVARALANRPKLVLADEPTASLDPANAQSALQLIRDLCRENQAALLLVSHDPATLATLPRQMAMPAPCEPKEAVA